MLIVDMMNTYAHEDAEKLTRQYGEDTLIATEDYAKRNPWQAMGMAAAAGLIVGVLLARR